MPLTIHRRDHSGPTFAYDAMLDDVAIGYGQIRTRASHNADLPPEAANNIYYMIAEPYRGKGHGKAFFGLLLDEARKLSLAAVRVTVLSDNPVSKHIIEAHGARHLDDFVTAKGETYHLYEIHLSKE